MKEFILLIIVFFAGCVFASPDPCELHECTSGTTCITCRMVEDRTNEKSGCVNWRVARFLTGHEVIINTPGGDAACTHEPGTIEDCSTDNLVGTSTIHIHETFKNVTCDEDGWTVIQSRGQYGNPKDYFNRGWEEYKMGFGEADKEYWLGNEYIYQMTKSEPYDLRILLTDEAGVEIVGYYNNFTLTDEATGYAIHTGEFTQPDSNPQTMLDKFWDGTKFSTPDSDNDNDNDYVMPGGKHCAAYYQAGWWFRRCRVSNLNGMNIHPRAGWRGIFFGQFSPYKIKNYSWPKAQMAIRKSNYAAPSGEFPF